jgi:hypothetical protein
MFHRYDYEAAFYPKLTRLPLDVRRKLDVTGVKISLKDWLGFSLEERLVLCHLPCDHDDERQVFTAYLDFLAEKYCGTPIGKTEPMDSAMWSPLAVPEEVAQKSAALGQSVTANEWRGWPSHHRYGLYKLAVSKSQPEAFEQVLIQLRNSLANR